jgi:hypothetical protein
LYQKYESAPKVVDELKKEGIHLSPPTILKRVRSSKIYMNPSLVVPVTVEMKIECLLIFKFFIKLPSKQM